MKRIMDCFEYMNQKTRTLGLFYAIEGQIPDIPKHAKKPKVQGNIKGEYLSDFVDEPNEYLFSKPIRKIKDKQNET